MPETELGNAQLEAVAQVPEDAGVDAVPPPPPPPQATNPAPSRTEMLSNLINLIFIECPCP